MEKYAMLALLLLSIFVAAEPEYYISINPREAVVEAEEQVPFIVGLVEAKTGEVQQVLPWDFQFSARRGQFAGSVYQAPKQPGTDVILVRYKEVQGIALVTVRSAEPVKKIDVDPQRIEVAPGGECQFSAKVYGKSGKVLDFLPAWGAKGGTIDEVGKFLAGDTVGEFNIVALGPDGIKGNAIVVIRQASTLSRLEVSPDKKEIHPRQKIQFKARGFDQKGKELPVSVRWKASGGQIDTSGQFTAGDETGIVTVEAFTGDEKISARAVVQIVAQPAVLTRIEIVPIKAQIFTKEQIQLSAKGFDQYDKEINVSVQWQSEGGQIDERGVFTATKAGKYQIIAVDRSGKYKAKTIATVVDPPTVLAKIRIMPPETRAYPGEKISFSALGYDQDKQKMPVRVRWQAKGGEIDEQGRFTAGDKKGKFAIVAVSEDGKVYGHAQIVIVPRPLSLARLEISGGEAQIYPGGKLRFTVKGYDVNGREMPKVRVKWQAIGGNIDQQGGFTASDKPGKFVVEVIAKRGKIRAKFAGEIAQLPVFVSRLEIVPVSKSLYAGDSFQFVAKAYDREGREVEAPLQWEATGGTIDEKGLFTAGLKTGKYIVAAISSGGNVVARATVEIILRQEPRVPVVVTRVELSPQRTMALPGERIEFLARAFDQKGEEVETSWIWSAEGGSIDAKGIFVAGSKPGVFKIRAKNEKANLTAEASVTVVVQEKNSEGYQLLVSPPRAVVKPGEQVRFQSTLYTGNPQREVWTWPWEFTYKAPHGSFDDTIYTAPKTPGVYKITVAHPKATGEAVVIVRSEQAIPKSQVASAIRINKKAVNLDAGSSYTFLAKAVDDIGNVLDLKLLWQAEGGTITRDGVYTAGQKAGIYKIILKEPVSGVSEEIIVTIRKPAATRFRIAMTPDEIDLPAGQSQKLAIKLYDGLYEVWTWPWDFKVTPSAGRYSETESMYIAPQEPGEYHLTITHEKAKARIKIKVREAQAKIERIVISPRKALLRPNKKYRFKAKVYDSDGKQVNTALLQWGCTGGGEVSPKGIYHTGSAPGSFKIWVAVSGTQIRAEAEVRIAQKQISKLKIIPENPKLATGESMRFKVYYIKNEKKRVWVWPWEVQCTASAGSFDKTTYTAPDSAGVHTINMRYKNFSAKTKVTVVERAKVVHHLEITPGQVELNPMQKQKFTAKAVDKNGREMESSITWQAESGTIDTEGSYIAGEAPGTYHVTAIDEKSGKSTSATVKIADVDNAVAIVIKPDQVVLAPGKVARFQAFVQKRSGQLDPVPVEWTASGGKIDESGLYTAGKKTGKDYVVSARYKNLQGSAAVGVSDFEAMQLKIEPEKPILKPGATLQFNVKAYDIHGNAVDISPRWFSTGGSISKDGLYTAGEEEGFFQVTAIDPRSYLFVKASISIKNDIAAEQKEPSSKKGFLLEVHPGDKKVKPGENVVLKPTLKKDEINVWTWPWDFRYSTTGGIMVGEYGNIWIAPNVPGKYKITVSHRDAVVTLDMVVADENTAKIQRLEISPDTVVLSSGQKKQFVAKAFDANGKEFPCNVQWAAEGGKIDKKGYYIAGSLAGKYKIYASSGALKTEVLVTITDESSVYQLGKEWGKSLRDGVVTRFQVKRFISASIFTKTNRELDQFRKGFMDSYGRAGNYLMKEFLCHIANDFGKLYGHDLYWGNITKAELIFFIRSYILRLPESCHHTFKRGFLNGYKHFRGLLVYQKIWREAVNR